jgi:hypothetical protein
MQTKTITGFIISVVPIVAGGNTLYAFTLMKEKRQYAEWKDEVYAAVFVADGSKEADLGPIGISPLTLRMSFLARGTEVDVVVESDDDVPVAATFNEDLVFKVVSVSRKIRSERMRPD